MVAGGFVRFAVHCWRARTRHVDMPLQARKHATAPARSAPLEKMSVIRDPRTPDSLLSLGVGLGTKNQKDAPSRDQASPPFASPCITFP